MLSKKNKRDGVRWGNRYIYDDRQTSQENTETCGTSARIENTTHGDVVVSISPAPAASDANSAPRRGGTRRI